MRSSAFDDAERGLFAYVRTVAAALGASAASTVCDITEPADAYIALDQRLTLFPERAASLFWDEEHGWAVAIDARSGDQLVVVAYLGDEVLPVPTDVVTFALFLLAGRNVGQLEPSAPGDRSTVLRKLAGYTRPADTGI